MVKVDKHGETHEYITAGALCTRLDHEIEDIDTKIQELMPALHEFGERVGTDSLYYKRLLNRLEDLKAMRHKLECRRVEARRSMGWYQ
jgi:hypothetical protein